MSDRLVQAAWDGDINAIRAIVAMGDDPNEIGAAEYMVERQARRWVGLPLAAAREQLLVIEVLLAAGARLDVGYGTQGTALHSAALNAHLDVVKRLLARGADPNARDVNDGTPLHHVARSRSARARALETAETLLAAGADPRAKNRLGKMPSGITGNAEVAKLLRKASAKARPPAVPRPPKPIAPAPPLAEEAPRPHAILKGALERATPDELPSKPPHLCGPTVSCPALGTIHIALWMAELARPFVRADERTVAADALALVRAFLKDVKNREPYGDLVRAATDAHRDSPALGIIRRPAGAAASLCRGKQDLVWTGARGAAQRMVTFLRDARDTPRKLPSVREFLEQLDQRILCAEMMAALRNLKPLPRNLEVVRVLWRGADMRIGELASGEHAFVGKLKGKWTCSTGTLDDALACVPDAWFPIATAYVSTC